MKKEDKLLTFVCNVCGMTNADVPLSLVSDREGNSCRACGSSLRVRSVIHALTSEIFRRSLPLPSAPPSKSIHGLGMSDWEGYAKPLERIFSYHNTFYHQEPRLDITAVPELVFHGGDGFTLFMRMFSEKSLLALLAASGFTGGVKIYRDDDPRYGIIWPISWCLAMVARKAR